MPQYTLRDRCRYRFDNFMARGERSIFLTLILVFVSVLVAVSMVRGVMLSAVPAIG